MMQMYVCPGGTDLVGVYANNAAQCNIVYDTCDSTTPLGVALKLDPGETVVVEDQICQLNVPELKQCRPNDNLPNALVYDQALCNAAVPAIQCPGGSDLAGIWVNPASVASCNISPADILLTTNPQA